MLATRRELYGYGGAMAGTCLAGLVIFFSGRQPSPRPMSTGLWILMSNWAWCIGIVYSTMATRQHVVVDVLAGLAVGTLGAYRPLRQREDADAAGKIRRLGVESPNSSDLSGWDRQYVPNAMPASSRLLQTGL